MMLICFFCFCQALKNNGWLSLLPLLSSIIVIVLFIIDRAIGARSRRKEVERNWYLKVLIEPSIAKISIFYRGVYENLGNSFDLLKTAHSVETHAIYLDLVAKEIGKLSTLKREFEGEVIMPIQGRYPITGGRLTGILLTLEDQFSDFLNSTNLESQEKEDFSRTINSSRSLFLNILYEPIKA
jgi:hypothetical protein